MAPFLLLHFWARDQRESFTRTAPYSRESREPRPSSDQAVALAHVLDIEEQDEQQAQPSLARFLLHHKRDSQSSSVVEKVSGHYGCTDKTSMKFLQATAEQSLRYQIANFEKLVHYAWTLVEGGEMQAIAFLEYSGYDETPLRVRVAFRPSDRGGVPQVAKVYVVLGQAALILKKVPEACHGDASDFLIMNFSAPVALRACDRGTAEGIVSVLRSSIISSERVGRLFPLKIRLAETDSLKANLKAERVLHALHPTWHTLPMLCTAHRVHTIADKSWSLVEGKDGALTGVLRTLMVLQGATQLLQLQNALETLVSQRFEYIAGQPNLTEDAERYRQNVLSTFMVQGQSARKKAVTIMFGCAFNGDWRRSDKIQHLCPGHHCCRSPEESLQNQLHALRTFMRSHRPSTLCKANWLDWHKPMCYVGILSHVHGMLGIAFRQAFATDTEDPAYLDALLANRTKSPNI